jgi:hypothetical protein
MSNDEWVTVGSVTVDSGRCLVVDPTYHRDGLYGVDEIGAATMASVTSPSQVAPLNTPDGTSVGAVIATGYGDGDYPVEVRYITDGRGAARISEMRVRFIEPE